MKAGNVTFSAFWDRSNILRAHREEGSEKQLDDLLDSATRV